MQEVGLSLLRLGWKLQGHEVCGCWLKDSSKHLLIVLQRLHQVPSPEIRDRQPPSRVRHLAPSRQAPSHYRTLHQRPNEAHLRAEPVALRDPEEGGAAAGCQRRAVEASQPGGDEQPAQCPRYLVTVPRQGNGGIEWSSGLGPCTYICIKLGGVTQHWVAKRLYDLES